MERKSGRGAETFRETGEGLLKIAHGFPEVLFSATFDVSIGYAGNFISLGFVGCINFRHPCIRNLKSH